MKRFLYILILFSILLSGCSKNSTYENAILCGEKCLSNSEYDAALEQFQIALNEKQNDNDALVLKEQTEKYMRALLYYNQLKYDESLKLLESVINMVNGSDELIEHAKIMKNIVSDDKVLDNNIKQYTISAQNYFVSGNYEKSLNDISIALKYINNNENYTTEKSALYSLKDNCNHALINKKQNSLNQDNNKKYEEVESEKPSMISKSQAKIIAERYIKEKTTYKIINMKIENTVDGNYPISVTYAEEKEDSEVECETKILSFYVDIYTGNITT